MMDRPRARGQKGINLIIGTAALVMIIPAVGLTVDVGVLYVCRTRLQAAVDGATLAAARALSDGTQISTQETSATNNATNWFNANFPAGSWSTSGTQITCLEVAEGSSSGLPATCSSAAVSGASYQHLRVVSMTAQTSAPTYFMKWFGVPNIQFAISGSASRRDAVIMLVLDRSGSMNNGTTPSACQQMVTAAKLFTGQFAEGRDRIGMISFSDNTVISSAPTTSFQTTLGYSNVQGSGSGAIDNITCGGGTGTAQAISLAYNELYKANMPGALNAIMLETDGLPNTLTFNWWDSSRSAAGLASLSNTTCTAHNRFGQCTSSVTTGAGCQDANNLTVYGGGFQTASSIPDWTGNSGYNLSTGGSGTAFDFNGFAPSGKVPAGIVGALYTADPSQGTYFIAMFYPWASSPGTTYGATRSPEPPNPNSTPGCEFNSNGGSTTINDLAWLPTTDVYGNQLNPSNAFKSPVNSDSTGHYIVAGDWTSDHNGALNATDNAAYQARSNSTLPVSFFVVGLGGNGGDQPDYILLQRIANDPNGDLYNNPPYYSACSSETNTNDTCLNYPAQPQGTFIFAPNSSMLGQAFLKISSQILRLSH